MANIENYNQLLEDIKSILKKGLNKAYKAVDNIKVQTYWQVGERIVREELQHKERADYGKELIKKLAVDLSIHERTLYRVWHFYKVYPILTTVLSELSWSHYLVIMDIKRREERSFYEVQSIKGSWSVRELRKRIKDKEYEKIKKTGHLTIKLPLRLPAPENIFQNIYDWNFLELERNYSERQLEEALLSNIQKILLEFGHGFAFMGSQQKILIAEQWHKVDLIFYHRFLKCVVLVELKTEKFKPEFVGQVNKYLTYFRENKLETERDPIGLIICKEKDNEEVHYALGKLNEDVFVVEYKTHLPSEGEIKRKLKHL
ncbi:MAG: PDDEXK nuclease domain-containing protein [Nanoarchaeota archaeon]